MNSALERLCVDLFPAGVPAESAETPSNNVIHVCFAYKLAAKSVIEFEESLPGPAGICDSSGKPADALLTVRKTEQGDILVAIEGDRALTGRTLRIPGPPLEILLHLKERRGRAFAVASITEGEYNELVRHTNGKPTCIWQ